MSQAALSRVEILRIRSARNEASLPKKHVARVENGIKLVSNQRKIEIESEQSDTFIGRLPADFSISETWLGAKPASTPNWPCPAVIANSMDDETVIRVADKIGVLWKANIVNNEGLVSFF